MKFISPNSYLRALVLGATISALINSVFIIADWWAVSAHGSSAVLWLVLILVFPLIGSLLLFPISLLLAISKRIRKRALQTTIFLLIYFVIGILSLRAGNYVRMSAFERLADRSALLVEAIKSYDTNEGSPPKELIDLVPKYLSEIPETGMNAYPEYEYQSGDGAKSYEGNPWVLIVYTPSGGINFDMFVYFPKQNYPKHAYSSWLENIGNWAYCHE